MIVSYLRQSALDHLALAGRATEATGDAAVRIAERTLPAAVNLRGDRDDPAFIAAVREALGLELPTVPNTAASKDGLALLWLGPDEWLAVGHDAPPEAELRMAASLRDALGDLHAAVTEVLHPRVFGGVGHCAQSHLSKTAITLHQVSEEPAFHLYTRRSFSDYLWRWLEDAGREYGVAVASS